MIDSPRFHLNKPKNRCQRNGQRVTRSSEAEILKSERESFAVLFENRPTTTW